MHYVYQLTFPGGKKYIGIAHNIESRWRGHLHAARNNGRTAVASAIRKYGEKRVKRRVLARDSDRANILKLERQFIIARNSLSPHGYNILPGGADSPASDPLVREKIRQSKLRHWQDPVYKRRMLKFLKPMQRRKGQAPWNKGKPFSATSRQKMALAKIGTKQSAKTKRLRAQAMRRDWKSGTRREAFRLAMTGRRWITNGSIHRQLRAGELLPTGWDFGMAATPKLQRNRRRLASLSKRRGTMHSREMRERRWINDGAQQRLTHVDSLPTGWAFGLLTKFKRDARGRMVSH